LDVGRAWLIGRPLDVRMMDEAAQVLRGNHDFTTFRDTKCQAKSPVKTLDIASVEAIDEQVIFHFEARSFLHSQVRSMVGTLVEVGLGKMTVEDVAAALAAADRTRCGPVAPPDGLYLVRVDYDAK
jgi:tRNA pseudouridine38-40 synthase